MKNVKSTARDWQTRIRVWAAMVQGAYAIGYILYYAMGLVSPNAMESYLNFFQYAGFLSWCVLVVLLTHIVLGLWKIYLRNTFRMPLWELSQILLGLSIPFFLFPHFADTYGLSFVFGTHENYVDSVLLTYPELSWQFVAMVLAVGIHAQIGTHVVFRLRPWYPRIRWLIVIVLSLLPLAGLDGYFKTGYALRSELVSGQLASDDLPHPPTDAQYVVVRNIVYGTYALFGALYVITFGARALRLVRQKGKRRLVVRYADGRSVFVAPATTLLEASRIGGIPHASICGGRGRCTTCRVKVDAGMDHLSAVGEREAKALMRIGAAEGVRLACQTELLGGEVAVTLLLPPEVRSVAARRETADSVGRDVELAVMFADLRGFTHLSEGKLPYDVVFILNRYFHYIGEAIQAQGGTIDKFLGDGVLAYFGANGDSRTACRDAVESCRRIAIELAKVNEQLKNVLGEPLQIGIGLHFGDVVLGEVGYGAKSALTIIGDTVNTASRLQTLNKRVGSQLVLSTVVAATAGFDLSYLKLYKVQVRGRTESLRIFVVPDILKDLPRDSAGAI